MRIYSFALTVALGLSGCALHAGSSASGGNGSPTMEYDSCSTSCGLDQNSVAAGGAHTAILVNGAVRFSSVRSSNPAVATFTYEGNNKIAVESGAAGTTTLDLLDGSGRVVDGGVVTVVATATLRENRGWDGAVPLVLAGETLSFHVTTVDGNGRITKGDGSVRFTLGGTLQPAVALVDGDAIAFTGTPGAGTVDANCPDASLSQAISVVPPSAVLDLGMSAQLQPNDQAVVTVVPHAAGGPVYTGGCAWQVSDPSVTLDADVTPRLDLGAGEVAIFNVNRPGSYQVSCTVAGQTASVTISR